MSFLLSILQLFVEEDDKRLKKGTKSSPIDKRLKKNTGSADKTSDEENTEDSNDFNCEDKATSKLEKGVRRLNIQICSLVGNGRGAEKRESNMTSTSKLSPNMTSTSKLSPPELTRKLGWGRGRRKRDKQDEGEDQKGFSPLKKRRLRMRSKALSYMENVDDNECSEQEGDNDSIDAMDNDIVIGGTGDYLERSLTRRQAMLISGVEPPVPITDIDILSGEELPSMQRVRHLSEKVSIMHKDTPSISSENVEISPKDLQLSEKVLNNKKVAQSAEKTDEKGSPKETASSNSKKNESKDSDTHETDENIDDFTFKRFKRQTKAGLYTCKKCNQTFRNLYTLAKHMRSHTVDGDTTTSKAPPPTSTVSKPAENQPILPPPTVPTSNDAQQVSVRPDHPEASTNVQTPVFICGVCNMNLLSQYDLEQHMHEHLPDDQFECGLCKQSFSNSDNLQNHIQQVHSVNVEQFECGIWKQDFSTAESLQNHIKCTRRITVEEFSCGICNRSFTSSTSLEAHVMEHQRPPDVEQEQFVCGLCHADFQDVEELEAHMLAHTQKVICKSNK